MKIGNAIGWKLATDSGSIIGEIVANVEHGYCARIDRHTLLTAKEAKEVAFILAELNGGTSPSRFLNGTAGFEPLL